MGDHQHATIGPAQCVDPVGDDLKGVDVQATVRLIKDGEAGFQHRHLQDFHPLLLAAREADIQRPLEHIEVDLQCSGLLTG